MRSQGFGGDGVEAFKGFVEEQDARVVKQGERERGFLAHAVRALIDEGMAAVFEGERAQQLIGAGVGFAASESVDGAGEKEVLLDGEGGEESEGFGQHSDEALDGDGIDRHVMTGDEDLARGGLEQAGEHFEGSGFAGSVGTEEGADGAGGDFEVKAIDCRVLAVALGEIPAGDH